LDFYSETYVQMLPITMYVLNQQICFTEE
jgi:hypothetical protein